MTTAPARRPAPRRRSTADGNRRAGWQLWANAGVAFWLAAAVLVSLVHPFVPESRWLLVHLVLLGAVTNAIVVWSAHFAQALLKVAMPGGRHGQATRLVLLNAGVACVVLGIATAQWSATLGGAVLVAGSVAAHGIALALQSRAALPSRFGATVHYYVAAAAALPVGAGLGTVLARGLDEAAHGRVLLAHVAVNLLGWVGLTVIGTLLTLWPTILRTRIAGGAERASRQALPVLVGAVGTTAAGALGGVIQLTAAGVLAYVAAALWALRPMVGAARNRAPQSYAAWAVLAGVLWFVGSLAWLGTALAGATDWAAVDAAAHRAAVPLVAGFAAQVLLGALSYLAPVALGRAPSRTRAATEVLDRGGALRTVVVNLGLAVSLMPVPSLVRVTTSVVVLAGLASFLVLLPQAVRVARRGAALPQDPSRGEAPTRHVPEDRAVVRARHTGLAAVGLSAVVLAIAVGTALDPAALGTTASAADSGVPATGETTTVRVEARGMRFEPSSVDVPAGNRLVIEVVNRDTDVHDLALETGERSGRLAPGATGHLVVDAVGRSLDGWCTIVGHRQMGMALSVRLVGTQDRAGARARLSPSDGHHEASSPGTDRNGSPAPSAALDFMARPPAGFQARDAGLAPAPTGTVHRISLTVEEVQREVAVGVRQRLWTFGGNAPGPVLRGKVGDRFEVTLRNDASMGHSIDFHAGALAPDLPMRTVPPGQSHTFSFTATRSGVWMYHCSTMPMSVHIANGMFGAVVIDPPALPAVDREYLLVQSELYLGAAGQPADAAKVAGERPDAVVFNGFANQYDHDQLRARVGERVRIWVLDAGPNRPSSFHVVGGQFDTVFSEGAYLLHRRSPSDGPSDARAGGAQVLPLQPAQGGFVELVPPEAGHYPFVSHVMVDAERGAHGVLNVTP